MRATLGIRETFDSAHHLPGHPHCGQPHGHTYIVELQVTGDVPEDGMLIDFALVKEYLRTVVKNLDHRDLNPVLAPRRSTVENICHHIGERLMDGDPSFDFEVKVWEGEGKWCKMEWQAPDRPSHPFAVLHQGRTGGEKP